MVSTSMGLNIKIKSKEERGLERRLKEERHDLVARCREVGAMVRYRQQIAESGPFPMPTREASFVDHMKYWLFGQEKDAKHYYGVADYVLAHV